MFWDSSALVPYLVREASSLEITGLLENDPNVTVWWGAPVECVSALERRRRDEKLPAEAYSGARKRLGELMELVDTVQAVPALRSRAERLLATHVLRAADALHLAAALVACDESPTGYGFVSLDLRLREAAAKEGFSISPDAI